MTVGNCQEKRRIEWRGIWEIPRFMHRILRLQKLNTSDFPPNKVMSDFSDQSENETMLGIHLSLKINLFVEI